jgi:hypothetical protein
MYFIIGINKLNEELESLRLFGFETLLDSAEKALSLIAEKENNMFKYVAIEYIEGGVYYPIVLMDKYYELDTASGIYKEIIKPEKFKRENNHSIFIG